MAAVLGTTHSPAPGCVCKKYFFSIKVLTERKKQLLDKLDDAIERMPKMPL